MANKSDEIYEETLEKLARDEIEAGKSLDYIADKFDEEYIVDVMNAMVDVSAELQISDYKNKVCEICLNAQKQQKAFYKEFDDKWKSGLLRSEILWFLCEDSIKATAGFDHETYLQKSLRQLYIRGCQVYYEICVLISSGLADGAWARWRTLYELAILSEFIAENGEEAAKGYFDSESDESQYYEWARTLECFDGYRSSWKITFDSLFERCKSSQPHWKQVYHTASSTVHACARGTFNSFSGNGNECVGVGPQLYGIDIPAIYAAESITLCARYYLMQFSDLNICTYKETIYKWMEELRDCYKKLAREEDKN